MSSKFDWQIREGDQPAEVKRARWPIGSSKTIVFIAIASVLILVSWGYYRQQEARNKERLMAEVQAILDLQHKAYLEGDGDLFFASQDNDPDWFSAQLHPAYQAVEHHVYLLQLLLHFLLLVCNRIL